MQALVSIAIAPVYRAPHIPLRSAPNFGTIFPSRFVWFLFLIGLQLLFQGYRRTTYPNKTARKESTVEFFDRISINSKKFYYTTDNRQ